MSTRTGIGELFQNDSPANYRGPALDPVHTLLRTDETPDPTPLVAAAEKRRIPLAVLTVCDPGIRSIYKRRLALVRPDQHLAWHGDALPSDPGRLLATVTGVSN